MVNRNIDYLGQALLRHDIDAVRRDKLIKEYLGHWPRGPCMQALGAAMRETSVKQWGEIEPSYRIEWRHKWLVAGMTMENTKELIDSANVQLQESRKTLEGLANEVKALAEIVEPALMEHISRIRAARMTAVTEVRLALGELHDLRKFFLESDYEAEMARLARFVALCKELKALKESGVLDAVSDVVLKLAVGGEPKQ